MKLLRRMKLLALTFAVSVVIWGSLCMTASAKKCLLICLFDPVYECRVVCF